MSRNSRTGPLVRKSTQSLADGTQLTVVVRGGRRRAHVVVLLDGQRVRTRQLVGPCALGQALQAVA